MIFVELLGYILMAVLCIIMADASFIVLQQQAAHRKALARVAELKNARRQMRRM